jgi:DnaK suppressor protein
MADAKKSPLSEERARELLAAERERIEGELKAVARRLGIEFEQALDEAASEDDSNLIEEEAKDQAVARSLREQHKAVERAEQRLAEGTYGVSVDSGEPIPAKRLERIPWAERTKEEEERYRRAAG